MNDHLPQEKLATFLAGKKVEQRQPGLDIVNLAPQVGVVGFVSSRVTYVCCSLQQIAFSA